MSIVPTTDDPTFTVAQRDLLPQTWLNGPDLVAWKEGFGYAKDLVVLGVKLALKARMPGSDTFPDDAIPYASADAMIEQAPGETNADFILRLQGKWDTWEWGGTDKGVIDQLVIAGFTPTMLYDRDFAGDSLPTRGVREWLWLGVPSSWVDPGEWDDAGTGVWDSAEEWAWDFDTLALDVQRPLRLVKKWKDSFAVVEVIVFLAGGDVWSSIDDVWDDAGAGVWDADSLTSRLGPVI